MTAHKLFGLKRHAPLPKVRARYRELALRWHPDRNANSRESHERMIEINAAYAKLARK